MTDADRALKADCIRLLSGHMPADPAATLRAIAAHPAAALPADVYGVGGAVAELETRVAAVLAKPTARYVVNGVTAQLATLSVHAEARGVRGIALHPQSHLDLDEAGAIETAAGLRALRIGRHAPFSVAELDALHAPLAAVVVELPLRRAGYLLPDLAALEAIAGWCRSRGVPLHLDGARLWEAAAGYGVAPADLAALADTVYVSFYKGLGAPSGAMVAGPAATIGAMSTWTTRFGGNLYTAWPQAIAALDGLDRHLPRMPDYVAHARALAARLTGVAGVIVNPGPPQVNAFQLWFAEAPDVLAERNRAFARAHGVWLFNGFQPTALVGRSMAEIVVGDASDDATPDEAAGWISAFAAG